METLPQSEPTPRGGRPIVHLLLFAGTFLTATMAGAWSWAAQPESVGGWSILLPEVLARGLTYSVPLLLILGAHEMGHYVACRRYGVPATLPYFIPGIPLLVGTFGAVIRVRGPIPTRTALFDIAAAGPLAGFVVALPFMAFGVAQAQPMPPIDDPAGWFLGPPLISTIFERWFHGGADLRVGPVYGAAWVGMLITSMNLFPVGQLDGGHAVFALGPRVHRAVSWITIAAIGTLVGIQAAMYRTVPSYALWLGILIFLRDRHPRLLDEHAPVGRGRAAVAIALAVVFVLTFIALPLQAL